MKRNEGAFYKNEVLKTFERTGAENFPWTGIFLLICCIIHLGNLLRMCWKVSEKWNYFPGLKTACLTFMHAGLGLQMVETGIDPLKLNGSMPISSS